MIAAVKLPAAPASLPTGDGRPADLPGWDPVWSRLVTAATEDGDRTFHVLDTGPALAELGVEPTGTILAVHGNPTWSYLWRSLARASLEDAQATLEGGSFSPHATRPEVWRIVAPDQLDMGYSERLAHTGLPVPTAASESGRQATERGYRTLSGRIGDLDALVRALGLDADARAGRPLLSLGHDWGGVVSLGWAGRNADLVSGVMALNTAVHQDPDAPVPAPLRAALAGPLLPGSTVRTDAFLRVATALARPSLPRAVRRAYHAPYASADRRGGIGGFVADIPVGPQHGSHDELQRVAADLTAYGASGAPALILWGAQDPVFLDRYLADLLERLPVADLHRFETAGHLLAEDADIATPVLRWAGTVVSGTTPSRTPAGSTDTDGHRPLWHFLDRWREDPEVSASSALVDMDGPGNTAQTVTWSRLAQVVDAVAAGLVRQGVRAGDRVSLMVPPGRDLTAILYACLRIGAVGVVADAGLGITGMTRAVRSARPRWVIGEVPGLTVARLQSWPGRRLSVHPLSRPLAAALGVEGSVHRMITDHGGDRPGVPEPSPQDPAAILFTSGSTGPAKGVMYTHRRLAALAGLMRDVFDVRPVSSLLAGFAPFALLGPAIGATSATPEMSVTRPASLTARAVAEATTAARATMIFASPAALRNVVATAPELTEPQRAALGGIRLVLSAGAPVHPRLMAQVADIFPAAAFHSPYGMTESLLLTDIDRTTIDEVSSGGRDGAGAAADDGVCVGRPVGPVRVAIAPLGSDGTPSDTLLEGNAAAGRLGEVVVSAPHMKAGYDRLWLTDAQSRQDTLNGLEWHRTQDVGHLDDDGRLWIEGRVQHVVTTPQGPVAPGGPEARIDALETVRRSAIVGVGPAGTQAVVAVVEPAPDEHDSGRTPRPGLAPTGLTDVVRGAAAPVEVSAVLVTDSVPVDIRHQSKINRTRLARWADGVLAGGKVGRP